MTAIGEAQDKPTYAMVHGDDVCWMLSSSDDDDGLAEFAAMLQATEVRLRRLREDGLVERQETEILSPDADIVHTVSISSRLRTLEADGVAIVVHPAVSELH